MKLIELHILQSFPVSCLNRDDVGAPKTAIFGGCTRARISSQCLKRAVREMAHDLAPAHFAANRSRLIIRPLADAMKNRGVEEGRALEAAKAIGEYLATYDAEKEKDGALQVKTLMFLSPAEIEEIAAKVAAGLASAPPDAPPAAEEGKGRKGKKKDGGTALADMVKKACKEATKAVQLKDAADVAIFGRMVASDHTLTVEGAGMFSHALSTHKAENDVDFFSAVDDLKPKDADDAGAGMTGTLEFTSACYYRYAALNLDLLADKDHLAALSPDERKAVVNAFVRATLLAVPGARRNSMNANTLPVYVLGIVKNHGQPIQLVNAFEKPVWSKDGLAVKATEAMKAHHVAMKKTWDVATAEEIAIPDVSLNEFCTRIVAHVD
ncbi:MAG: type I-E CRISPR-associated protein Cas7/Cse4/CasC [Lentisphaerae bacterium RIFOXYB12_FULL_65_16]|nr:MAG: type I-E CRISPR-associated protein Cas7/Cse4/CasC [Lentisphaerae bacterium RIFOXYA12_64_32]OGV94032.1 MAG: type I-E CRISPR-associated protein Cas7/Cse4/CasC [Lentisphaerae bacterium RIFOXYB12_FULL_65_16]